MERETNHLKINELASLFRCDSEATTFHPG